MLVAIALLAILLVVTVSFYPSAMKAWISGKDNYQLRSELSQARDLMSKYLLKASTFTVINPGRIDFTANVDPFSAAAESCIFYLYNVNDVPTWPSTYPYASYELRFMTYNPGLGPPIFGSGRSILGDTVTPYAYPNGLLPPPTSYFVNALNQITISLCETKNNENLKVQFDVHPRNVP